MLLRFGGRRFATTGAYRSPRQAFPSASPSSSVSASPSPSSGGGFVMNVTSGAGPNYGFSSYSSSLDGVKVNRSFDPTGGPSGRPAVVFDFIENSSGSGGAMHWSGTPGSPSGTQGGSIFTRIWIYYSKIHDVRQPDGTPWGSKTFILTAAPDTERAIETMVSHTAALDLQSRYGKNINGPPDETDENVYASVGWNAIQYEVKFSTTTSSGDGGYRIWMNNDTQGSPNGTSAFTTSQDASAIGGGEMAGLDRIGIGQGPFQIKIAAFEIGTTFTSNWFSSM